jgi:hypothetical protein
MRKIPHGNLIRAVRFCINPQARTGRGAQAVLACPSHGEMRKWQRANGVWPSSMARENRRRVSRFRCFAKTTAAPINCRSHAALSMANGATMYPAAPLKQPWSAGACPASDTCLAAAIAALCHNATEISAILRIGTRAERTAPESVVHGCAAAFTARCRRASPGAAPYPAQRRSAAARASFQTLIAWPAISRASPAAPCRWPAACRRS